MLIFLSAIIMLSYTVLFFKSFRHTHNGYMTLLLISSCHKQIASYCNHHYHNYHILTTFSVGWTQPVIWQK
ncbi:hypothetical protein KUTeg_008929 [Tegillarca granosa]|uniref:Secreted protein n=1 Tax=Tegillarca granosa TaxID=220873 RepID=A0ABQ9FFC9_TEGGR|nr:hypothetical protein KUTeg_008929 [Tegillarca granosa]